MDASASPEVDTDFSKVCGFFLKIENTTFPTTIKQNNTVIKYTKLPDFDFDSNVSWPKNSYTLPPRLRRIISLDEDLSTSRSLQNDYRVPQKIMSSSFTKRKIVTITEDDENDVPPKLSQCEKKTASSQNTLYRSVGTDFNHGREPSQRSISRLSSSKHTRVTRPTSKTNTLNDNQDVSALKTSYKSKYASLNVQTTQLNNRSKNNVAKDRESIRKNTVSNVKTSRNKSVSPPSRKELDVAVMRNKMPEHIKTNLPPKKNMANQNKLHKLPNQHIKSKVTFLKEIKSKNKPVSTIHVPIDDQYRTRNVMETEIRQIMKPKSLDLKLSETSTIDCGTDLDIIKTRTIDCGTDVNINAKDMNVGTDPLTIKVDKGTDIMALINDSQIDLITSQMDVIKDSQVDVINDSRMNEIKKPPMDDITDSQMKVFKDAQLDVAKNSQMDVVKEFDSLDIPNVTLTKEKSDIPNEDLVSFRCQSLPNLDVPALKMTPQKTEKRYIEKQLFNGASYIIGEATLTCTTKQKINFQVLGNSEKTVSNLSSSPLAYPMNVISVYKKELKNKNLSDIKEVDTSIIKKKDQSNAKNNNSANKIQSLNCSYVIDSDKLVKPSDIISTIRVSNDLLQSDYICEQFQRELNFIDSFFESLQYLESCSDKCLTNNKVENWVSNSGFNVKTPEYDSFFSNFDNDANNEDTETMASKSLCLLNLLIRDEQRRAKNLLFVLKMREDALKDFTKSQILWLENKKKQDNTDISTLKKKQRGALLKLQHECGEMQRMRKTLLTLSEKRKVALMKTKKNIELKLKNNVSVDQIVLAKKKIKRNTAPDRNIAPLKCFDLSSSGCDESTTSRPKSDTFLAVPEEISCVKSAEKYVQTGESALETVFVNQATNTAAENFIAVDGSYLNILFRNLSMPQIFSSGKQYEVNEEALKNIVNSTNNYSTLNDGDVVEKFMDQIKNCDLDKSSTPSTARSLVEEFDQYYKVLAEEEKSFIDSTDPEYKDPAENAIDQNFLPVTIPETNVNCSHRSTSTMTTDSTDSSLHKSTSMLTVDQSCACEKSMVSAETQSIRGKDSVCSNIQTGPLPIPAGAAGVSDPTTADVPTSPTPELSTSNSDSSISSPPLCPSVSSVSSLTSPVHCEAEELRRQQLAIEREIKALEQQQCQLLVVREIPDKPPPPYTPPTDSRVNKPPPMFIIDETLEEKIHKNLTDSDSYVVEPTDTVELFIQEFCQEMSEKQNLEQSDKPWDACNLLPQKSPTDLETLVNKTTTELKETLSGVQPTVVTGVGARRSDHIDDILFAEWRRCEPEWTALHTDEAIVKNQIFESIFQKILSETVDEYKKTVPVENFEVPK